MSGTNPVLKKYLSNEWYKSAQSQKQGFMSILWFGPLLKPGFPSKANSDSQSSTPGHILSVSIDAF